MLVLVRKVEESIWFSGDIVLTVLDIQRDRVKLGVLAPDHVKVMRQELVGGDDARRRQREAGPDGAECAQPRTSDRR